MLDNIIDKNIIFLKNHGVKMDDTDDKAVYKYGLQILYYYIIDLIVIFSLAYILGELYETVIMMLVFGLLQVFGGGYHAKTPAKCLLTMITGMAAGNILIALIRDILVLNVLSTVVFSGVIFALPSVTNNRHPVGRKTERRAKSVVKFILILIVLTVFILGYFNHKREVAAITVILSLYLFSATVSRCQNKNKKSEASNVMK